MTTVQKKHGRPIIYLNQKEKKKARSLDALRCYYSKKGLTLKEAYKLKEDKANKLNTKRKGKMKQQKILNKCIQNIRKYKSIIKLDDMDKLNELNRYIEEILESGSDNNQESE